MTLARGTFPLIPRGRAAASLLAYDIRVSGLRVTSPRAYPPLPNSVSRVPRRGEDSATRGKLAPPFSTSRSSRAREGSLLRSDIFDLSPRRFAWASREAPSYDPVSIGSSTFLRRSLRHVSILLSRRDKLADRVANVHSHRRSVFP